MRQHFVFRFGMVPLLFAAIACSLLFPGRKAAAQGVGDLLIAPTRLVFDGAKRTAEVNLINIGDKQATYRISLIHERMNDDGKLEEIQASLPGEQFADDLVRFTPRQVVLDPHASQLVRVQLRLPAELAPGEYRSHMLFRAVPVPGAPSEQGGDAAPQGLSIRITPIYGVSIPVIVRSGKTSATAGLENLKFGLGTDGLPALTGRLTRDGSISVYGDLQIAFASAGGSFRPIGRLGGVAVYTPNTGRNFTVRLTPPDGVALQNGTIRVTYRQTPDDGNGVLAEATVPIP